MLQYTPGGSDPSCLQHLSSSLGQDLRGNFCTSPVKCFNYYSFISAVALWIKVCSHPPGYPPPLTGNPKGVRAVGVSAALIPLEWQPNSLKFPKLFTGKILLILQVHCWASSASVQKELSAKGSVILGARYPPEGRKPTADHVDLPTLTSLKTS